MTSMPLTSRTAREKREQEDIKTRCVAELEKAYARNDRPTVKLLRYLLEGATYGQTKRTYRPMVRNIFKKEKNE